eukprot:Gb_07971 [translate_table: standard]
MDKSQKMIFKPRLEPKIPMLVDDPPNSAHQFSSQCPQLILAPYFSTHTRLFLLVQWLTAVPFGLSSWALVSTYVQELAIPVQVHGQEEVIITDGYKITHQNMSSCIYVSQWGKYIRTAVLTTNREVTEAIQKVAAAYDCKIAEGVLSHQMKQFVIDGNKVILSASNADTRVDDAEFEENEVYAIDIVTSTGDGKPKLLDEKQTTIYKRAVDKNYHLKMKASRFIFSEINQKFAIMPFTARALEEKRARLGLVECVNHELLQPYPVLHEKPGDLIAHIKFTVLLMPNGSDKITGHPLQELKPSMTVEDPEIKGWLALGTKSKKKGGGKKKKGKKGEAQEEESADASIDGVNNMET